MFGNLESSNISEEYLDSKDLKTGDFVSDKSFTESI